MRAIAKESVLMYRLCCASLRTGVVGLTKSRIADRMPRETEIDGAVLLRVLRLAGVPLSRFDAISTKPPTERTTEERAMLFRIRRAARAAGCA